MTDPVLTLPSPAVRRARGMWRDGALSPGERALAEETPVAFTYDGATHAVMMATPASLEDFAVGFSLTEGIIAAASDIADMEIAPVPDGIDIRMWLHEDRSAAMDARRRRIAGPVGCGMCGLESLKQAQRPVPRVDAPGHVTTAEIARAIASLRPAQTLNQETRAVHAAGFWRRASGLDAVREDVGRHNALDKLAGALARSGIDPASGILLMTSRLSVELIQKAGLIGAPVIAGISAPTALAVRTAETAGITLVAIARDDGFEIFTHPHRITDLSG